MLSVAYHYSHKDQNIWTVMRLHCISSVVCCSLGKYLVLAYPLVVGPDSFMWVVGYYCFVTCSLHRSHSRIRVECAQRAHNEELWALGLITGKWESLSSVPSAQPPLILLTALRPPDYWLYLLPYSIGRGLGRSHFLSCWLCRTLWQSRDDVLLFSPFFRFSAHYLIVFTSVCVCADRLPRR